MPTENDTPAPSSATLAISNIPGGDSIVHRAWLLANGAKTATWCGMDEHGVLPTDEMFLRGALALLQMLEASEAMREAPMLASLLASSFTGAANDTPTRTKLFAMSLDDPSRYLAQAVATNRQLAGLPPQLEVVPDEAGPS